jgi:hypothetical protein
MCWWKITTVRAVVMISFLVGAGVARGEVILKLEHGAKAPVKTKKAPVSSKQNEPEFERYGSYLLGGKKEQLHLQLTTNKKAAEPEIRWDEKHAKATGLKAPKAAAKPKGNKPQKDLWAMEPQAASVPMAASSAQLPAGQSVAVPAPRALWAGLGMLVTMGMWRWVVQRRRVVG